MADQRADTAQTALKERAAQHAAGLVRDGMVVGLGSGSTSALMVRALGARVAQGLRVTGVPTSESTEALARSLGIGLATLDDQPHLDLTIDGADEVDPSLNLVKGLGGALLREKIVASASDRLVIMVDPSKLVDLLGSKAPLPVEVVPFGWRSTARRLEALGATVERRAAADGPFITDGGHYILHCRFAGIADPPALSAAIKGITGVVDHGLFLGMAGTVIVGYPDRISTLER